MTPRQETDPMALHLPTSDSGVFVQIGAGAGDQDARANYRDGFTEFVKRLDPTKVSRIILVEPNPVNLPALRMCWKDYAQAQIVPVGIRPRSHPDAAITFYYAEEDGPHYQVFSLVESHVRAHYPNGTIRSVEVATLTIQELLLNVVKAERIDLLALDIEGVDAQILLEIDWATMPCHRVSFEFVHLGEASRDVHRALGRAGYVRIGWGLDTRRLDVMYEKPRGAAETIVAYSRWLFGGWWTIHSAAARRVWRDFRGRR